MVTGSYGCLGWLGVVMGWLWGSNRWLRIVMGGFWWLWVVATGYGWLRVVWGGLHVVRGWQ